MNKQVLFVCAGSEFPQGAFNFLLQMQQHFIRHQLHEHDTRWDKQILEKESRYADLVLLSGELFYADINIRQPNVYLHEALYGAECPILVIPESYQQCDHLFFAFDGSKESMFAIKQFSYLFPNLTDLPAEVVYIKDENSAAIPDVEHLRRYARQHFESMGLSKLQFKASRYFATWIGEHKQVMLITGSYGRSMLSYMTKRSFAEQVVQEHKIPVFIAHA